MKLVAAVAVLLIWPVMALAKPAPLPPGVAASSAAPVTGLYIHATDDWGSRASEIWFYRAGGRTVMYSARPSRVGEAQMPAVGEIVARGELPAAFRPDGPPCDPERNRWCVTGTVDGVPVHCWRPDIASIGVSECESIETGRTLGMRLDSEFVVDDGSRYHHFNVDRIDRSASIDPAVFQAAGQGERR
jgi:hypothetical protein